MSNFMSISLLYYFGARRLREVIAITAPIIHHRDIYVNWLPLFNLPHIQYLCAIALHSLASVFPVGVVDIIMLKFFKGLNENFNLDRFSTRMLRYDCVYIRNAYFRIRTLGC